MKKLLLLIAFAVMSFCAISQDNSLTFKNISVSGEIDEFLTQLKNNGYIYKEQVDNVYILEGKFVDYDCSLYVVSTPTSKQVCKVMVVSPKCEIWSTAKSKYEKFKDLYISKYGKPTNSYEFFSKPYFEGDGYEMQALRNDKCNYISFWDVLSGCVYVEIGSNGGVKFTYENEGNMAALKKEKSDINRNDI